MKHDKSSEHFVNGIKPEKGINYWCDLEITDHIKVENRTECTRVCSVCGTDWKLLSKRETILAGF